MNHESRVMNRKSIPALFILASCFLLLASTPVLAQTTEYQLLAPLPLSGPDQPETTRTTAAQYLQGIFILIIGIATVLAVLAIIYGGIKYMSTDAFGEKNEAKTTIQNAIWGLLLAIGAWLILFTVNPRLVNFNLSIPVQPIATTTGGSGTTGGGGIDSLSLTQQQATSAFRSANVGIASGINLAGIRQSTVDEVIRLKLDCNCVVTVTSATGGEHVETGTCNHINGYKADLRLNDGLSSYIDRNFNRNPDRGDGARIYTSPTGGVYAQESDHWDIAKCN